MSFPPRFADSPDFQAELRELLGRSGEPQDLFDRLGPEPVKARYETLPIPDRDELGLEYELLGGGQELPGFLKKAVLPGEPYA
jgi:hypothetical protein